jgi:2-iminobutanoate/2-iminopropanoate deaminase
MSKQIIKTDKAPSPIGPYSQAVKANGMVFLSGQVAFDPASGELRIGDLQTETHQVMKNLAAVMEEAHITF